MKIYTKTGDRGETGLYGGLRVSKCDQRVDAYGTVDELNAVLGVAQATGVPEPLAAQLQELQVDLFTLGSELACAPGKEGKLPQRIGEEEIGRLERLIDDLVAPVPPLQYFVLPGGTLAAAQLHHARTVCRRAERLVVALQQNDDGPRNELVIYLNRLSDLLFSAARWVNHSAQHADIPWKPRG